MASKATADAIPNSIPKAIKNAHEKNKDRK